ncbi:MAG TPA: alpha/beta hydrolase [Dehalococcoidales bacterium]|nr:alpha/beta hydrolase [Dehalococcoidales bacterium]
MKNLRIYGQPPYRVALVHGGPGAPGSIAPVARELSKTMSILEPLQTKVTIDGEVGEFKKVLEEKAEVPVILVGHSWGAWLSYILAARYPETVKKLILVGAGPFEAKYAAGITSTRFNRLSETEREETLRLIDIINGDTPGDRNEAMARYGDLMARADTYAPLSTEREPEPLPANEEINRKVWAQAEKLRESGELLEMGRRIKCPVVAIHGDYDPHPAEGVNAPLSGVLKDFRFILLKKCGHEPWNEKYARVQFFKILHDEILNSEF